jgi:3',5'-cyclic AMP phosphodiesterase CpdA
VIARSFSSDEQPSQDEVVDMGGRRERMIIAQISDPHLSVEADRRTVRGETELRRAVTHLNRLPAPPDLVVLSGDCADHGAAVEYDHLDDDDRSTMLATFGPQGAQALDGYIQYVVEGWPVRLILLDTSVPGRDEGRLSFRQLEWLEARLAERAEQPTLVVMHHPPFLSGNAALDEIGLLDAEAFGDIIAGHPQVEAVVAGHLHMTLSSRFRGTVAHTCGSTNHQLLPDLARAGGLAAVLEPPVCLLHEWRDATALHTYVSQIGDHGEAVTVHNGERWVIRLVGT